MRAFRSPSNMMSPRFSWLAMNSRSWSRVDRGRSDLSSLAFSLALYDEFSGES